MREPFLPVLNTPARHLVFDLIKMSSIIIMTLTESRFLYHLYSALVGPNGDSVRYVLLVQALKYI